MWRLTKAQLVLPLHLLMNIGVALQLHLALHVEAALADALAVLIQ